jgi:putative membrane protein
MVLPFAIVDLMGWAGIPVMALVAFTLYGIDALAQQIQDPFGYDKNDIKMDDILQDAQLEIEILLEEWMKGRFGLF